eukprot:g4339.t1
MADEDNSVSEFLAVTNSDAETAKFYLESCNGDVSAAIESYFSNADSVLPQTTNRAQTVNDPPVPVRPQVPSSRIAGLGDMMNEDDEDGSDEGPEGNEYYAGGQNSGVAIQGTGRDNPNTVENLFESARQHGAIQGTESDLQSTGGRRAFSGRGHVLSGGMTTPPPTNNEELNITITFYANRIFTVNDGEPRSVDDPANAEFIDHISRGVCPPELTSNSGRPLKVNLVKNGSDYKPPEKPRYAAFTGSSQTLSESVGEPSSHPVEVAPVEAGEWEGPDETKPMTSIQIRLADGSRVVARFNHTHTVRDIRRFVAALRSDVSHTGPLLAGYPSKPISNENQTIEEAGLVNAVVILK